MQTGWGTRFAGSVLPHRCRWRGGKECHHQQALLVDRALAIVMLVKAAIFTVLHDAAIEVGELCGRFLAWDPAQEAQEFTAQFLTRTLLLRLAFAHSLILSSSKA